MKRNRLLIILFSSAILFFMGSCGREADDASNEDDMSYENRDETIGDEQSTMQDENQFWTSNRDYTFDQRNEFRDDVNTAIDRLNSKITDLEETAASATGDTKKWYNDRVAELKDHRSEIQKELENFEQVTADSWDNFKSGIASTWNDIEDSYSEMARDDRMMDDQRY